MNIEIRDILTIEDKEYVVCSKMFYKGEKYIYLLNMNDNADMRFCLYKDGRIFETFDQETIDALLIQIAEQTQ